MNEVTIPAADGAQTVRMFMPDVPPKGGVHICNA